MKRITSEQFLEAWCDAWDALENKQEYANTCSHGTSSEWTNRMLSDSCGFLYKVKEQLECDSRKIIYWQEELFRVDVGFVSEDTCFMKSYGEQTYPLFIDVMIEHENSASTIHDEMWKLIFYRSPLKVIVFYDHHPDKKLKKMRGFLQAANDLFAENTETEYLFIVGNIRDDQSLHWRWASAKDSKLTELC